MKERPILMAAGPIRNILAGRQTQDRRPVKLNDAGRIKLGCKQWHPEDPDAILGCPYGQPGDRLWVKETYRVFAGLDGIPPREIREGFGIFYEADGDSSQFFREYGVMAGRIRQSIFMRRWMSRITLEITGVRVERLQDISEGDAKAEGAPCELGKLEGLILGAKAKYRSGFVRIWESCYGVGSWDANPWVWVVEFKRLESEVQP